MLGSSELRAEDQLGINVGELPRKKETEITAWSSSKGIGK